MQLLISYVLYLLISTQKYKIKFQIEDCLWHSEEILLRNTVKKFY